MIDLRKTRLSWMILLALPSLWAGSLCGQTKPWSQLVADLGLSELKIVVEDRVAETVDRTDAEALKEASARLLLEKLDLLPPAGLDSLADLEDTVMATWARHPISKTLEGLEKPEWLVNQADTVAEFERKLNRTMEARITTGYNILPWDLWPDFEPSLTVVYGHNHPRHARQILALLYLHDIWPRVTLLMKQSAFLYKEAWGVPQGGKGCANSLTGIG